jgi:hypothetical protein
MLYDNGDETGHASGKSSSVAKTESVADFGLPAAKASAPAAVFHPLAYRGVVAEWPVELRERWGHRANALEESGLTWRDAETQAFVEVWNFVRGQQSPQLTAAHADSSPAEQN